MSELEIHHINVSQGDSTLIINRDVDKVGSNIDAAISKDPSLPGKPSKKEDFLPFAIKNKIPLDNTIRKAVLIDAGDDVFGQDVADYLKEQGVTDTTQFITVVTHFHADHVGGFAFVFYKFNNKVEMERQHLNLPPKVAYRCGDLNPAWDFTGSRTNYLTLTKELVSRTKTTEQVISANETIEMEKDKDGTEINLRCIASNGTVSVDKSITKQVINPKQSPDQNARSAVFVVEYGDFRYFLGGDSAGTGNNEGGNFKKNMDSRLKKAFSTHPDTETALTKVLPKIYKSDPTRKNTADGHVCVHTANHHGSASSNDVFLIEQMQPKVVICSSGVRLNFHWHPTQEFFQRTDPSGGYSKKWQKPGDTQGDNPTIDNTVADYYITEMAEDGKYGKGKSATEFKRSFPKGKILGDIIVRPISPVAPANTNGAITIQIYGTGIGTDSSVANIPLRSFEAGNGAASVYPIGPYTHTCDKH